MGNLRLMGYTQSIFPASRLYTPLEVVALKMTGSRMPSTCRVEPTFVRTFDNKTVEYKINDCEHVLLLDGSKHIPMAVTTRTVSGSEKKIVKILSGITEAQIIPTSSGSMKVLIHREEVRPMVGEKLIKKNVEGKVIAMIQRFEDNVVSIYVPEHGLKQEFQRESTQCSRETIIPTPVSKLYERISVLNKPTGMSHIVDKQSTKLCIS